MTRLIEVAQELANRVDALAFSPPVNTVYNPLSYAWRAHRAYLEKWGQGPKEVILLGMNPGPWGMVQTGVPFGEISLVRDWLGIEEPIGQPEKTHPRRPIEGFSCSRSEVSGARLWGWARERFGSPETFFERFFVHNYCPLAFLEESGRNRTPDKLPRSEKDALFTVCYKALRQSVQALDPKFVIGVGKFSEGRARAALEGLPVAIGRVLHPSPASPLANRGWSATAERELLNCGIALPPNSGA